MTAKNKGTKITKNEIINKKRRTNIQKNQKYRNREIF